MPKNMQKVLVIAKIITQNIQYRTILYTQNIQYRTLLYNTAQYYTGFLLKKIFTVYIKYLYTGLTNKPNMFCTFWQ